MTYPLLDISFSLPQKVSLNAIYAGLHWSKRAELADLYHREILPFRKLKIDAFPVALHYTFTFRNRPLDSSNCAFLAKMIEDGLVAHAILPDDSMEYVRSTTTTVALGKEDRVRVQAVPVDSTT